LTVRLFENILQVRIGNFVNGNRDRKTKQNFPGFLTVNDEINVFKVASATHNSNFFDVKPKNKRVGKLLITSHHKVSL
jgi:hypothetical protein